MVRAPWRTPPISVVGARYPTGLVLDFGLGKLYRRAGLTLLRQKCGDVRELNQEESLQTPGITPGVLAEGNALFGNVAGPEPAVSARVAAGNLDEAARVGLEHVCVPVRPHHDWALVLNPVLGGVYALCEGVVGETAAILHRLRPTTD